MNLNPFQFIALAVIGSLFALTLVALARRWVTKREGLAWALVWLAAGTAVAWPGLTGVVAGFLGIGRGADLILYCTVVVVLCGFMMVYVRLRHLRRDVTILVRELAIRDAHTASPESSSSDADI